MAERDRAACETCGEALDVTAPGVAQFSTGWAVNRQQGGTNALVGQERHRRWICRHCVDKTRAGVPIGHGSLFSL